MVDIRYGRAKEHDQGEGPAEVRIHLHQDDRQEWEEVRQTREEDQAAAQTRLLGGDGGGGVRRVAGVQEEDRNFRIYTLPLILRYSTLTYLPGGAP